MRPMSSASATSSDSGDASPRAIRSSTAYVGFSSPRSIAMLAPASVRLTIRARAAAASVTSLPSEKRSGSGLSFVAATQLDFAIAILSVALVFLIGGLAGVAAGFFGGWTDRIVSRIADTIMAFPLFVLAMGIVAALGNTVQNIILATAIINFPLYARVARAEAKDEAGLERLMGQINAQLAQSGVEPVLAGGH